jgi:hypothetical protein
MPPATSAMLSFHAPPLCNRFNNPDRRHVGRRHFGKNSALFNAGSDAELHFYSISDTPAIIGHSSRNAERRMYLKLTKLFLLIGFVVGLPYLFEKIWAICKSEAGNRHH